MANQYEVAIYADDVMQLAENIMNQCAEVNAITDDRIRVCIIVTAMLTAAQTLDGNAITAEGAMEVKFGGIADSLRITLARKTVVR